MKNVLDFDNVKPLNEWDENDFRDFYNLDDRDESWKTDELEFEWTTDDLQEFERERRHDENNLLMMAAWWDMEGVRCGTFERNPKKNPYR